MKKGFTLIELLIVVSIIAVLAGAVFFANLFSQIGKSRDTRRMQEIATLQKLLEDYYNDHDQYLSVDSNSIDGLGCKTNPNRFKPYLSILPCDPQYPNHTYAYVSDDGTYQTYRIYALLEYPKTQETKSNPCASGCSVSGKTYNYLVTSPNINIVTYPQPPSGYIGPLVGNEPTVGPTTAPTIVPSITPTIAPTVTSQPTTIATPTPNVTGMPQCPASGLFCLSANQCNVCNTPSNCKSGCGGYVFYQDGSGGQCSIPCYSP